MRKHTENGIAFAFAALAIAALLLVASQAKGATTRPVLPALPAPPVIVREQSLPISALPNLVPVSGTRYKFAAGTLNYVGDGFRPPPNDVEYAFASGSTINAKLNRPTQNLFSIPFASSRVAIRNVNLSVNAIIAILDQGADVTIDHVNIENGMLLKGESLRRVRITGCSTPPVPEYWLFFEWVGEGNYDVTIDHCVIPGSIKGHDIRAYGLHRGLIDTCTLLNPESIVRPPGVVHGECLKLCDGSDITVKNCTFDGPIQIGANYGPEFAPKADWNHDGRIDNNDKVKINGTFYVGGAPITPLLKDLRFENCTDKMTPSLNSDGRIVSEFVYLQPGVTNFTWSGGAIAATASYAFSVRSNHEYPDRPVISGLLENLAVTTGGYAPGTLFFSNWPGGVHVGAGVTVNGKVQARN